MAYGSYFSFSDAIDFSVSSLIRSVLNLFNISHRVKTVLLYNIIELFILICIKNIYVLLVFFIEFYLLLF